MSQKSDCSNARKSHDEGIVTDSLVNGQRDTVSSQMDAERVVSRLDDHGCRDITYEVDFSTMTDFEIGHGGFGLVYQARMRDGREVAIKTLRRVVNNPGETDCKSKKRAGKEGYSWSKFKHPNILQLLGVAQHNGQVVLISPWMKRGTLSEYILCCPEAKICDLASQVAEGLTYMHSVGAVHGDVKGANILVSDNNTAMLADFGSTVLEAYSLQFTPSGATGCTARWASPEILEGDILSSMEGDVWALGMEIVTGKPPYSNLKREPAVTRWVTSRRLPLRPEAQFPANSSFGDQLWELLASCWAFEPSSRPTAAYVRDCLKAIAATEEYISRTESSN